MSNSRRNIKHVTGALALGIALMTSLIHAEVSVPAKLQAQLIGKVAGFDRNFAARARGSALILVVQKPGHAGSTQLAQQMVDALRDIADVGGVPQKVDTLTFTGAASLAVICKARKAAVVYLSSGLEQEAGAIASALIGGDVLSVGAAGAHAENGAVIGFDLEGGKPKLVINLSSSKAQNVAFKAELLKLARIVKTPS